MGKELVKHKSNALEALATRMQMDPVAMKDTLMKTAFANCKTEADFVSAVIVANTYGLNPLTKEMYAFPARNGGIIPIVSVDGWVSLMQRHKGFNGIKLLENFNDAGEVESVTCTIFLKGKDHPVEITEYMVECKQDKDTWRKYPRRMLRHKALIQCARVAFGFSGIYDEDEAERIVESEVKAKPIVALPKEMVIDKVIEIEGEKVLVSSEDVPDNNLSRVLINRAQQVKLFATTKDFGVTEAKLKDFIKKNFDHDSTSELTNDELDETYAWLDDYKEKK